MTMPMEFGNMTAKMKTFDCMKMKNQIQAERMAEYESRRMSFRRSWIS